MTGWQGKHWGDCCLFVWREGAEASVEQRVDADCRLDAERLASRKLEPGLIPIYGAECDQCGTGWRDSAFHVSADVSSGIWLATVIDPSPRVGRLLASEWLVCPSCLNAIRIAEGQLMTVCEDCSILVRLPKMGEQAGDGDA